jgi:hypothetical protein
MLSNVTDRLVRQWLLLKGSRLTPHKKPHLLSGVSGQQVQKWLLRKIQEDINRMEADQTPRPASYDNMSFLGYARAEGVIQRTSQHWNESLPDYLERLQWQLNKAKMEFTQEEGGDDEYSTGSGSIGSSLHLLALIREAYELEIEESS